jgi:hypothetical protein
MDWLSSVVGSFFTSTAVASVVTAVIQGAIVGAAIGGITALISGGSLSKGILFGAVGGAVAGGFTEYFTNGIQNRMDAERSAEVALRDTGRVESQPSQPAVGGETKTTGMLAPSWADTHKEENQANREFIAGQQERSIYAGIGQGVFSGLGSMYSAGKAADTAKETAASTAATSIAINTQNNADALERQRLIGVQQREQQDINIAEAKRAQDVNVGFQREALLNPAKEEEEARKRRSTGLLSLSTKPFITPLSA